MIVSRVCLHVCSALQDMAHAVPVHLEMASMADPVFLAHVAHTLFPHADSFGLNEQELTMLYAAIGGTFAPHGPIS